MSLFPGGSAVTIGVRKPFNFLSELESARTIRLATAFGHKSGWDLIAESIEKSQAETSLLAGQSFFQTEPYLLRAWLKLSESQLVRSALYLSRGVTFHPKVLIVEGRQDFAIVGSGNLSVGGLRDNVECGFFVESASGIKELIRWFDALFNAAPRLSEALLFDYEKKWNALRLEEQKLANLQKQYGEELVDKNLALWKNWNDAVAVARAYQLSADFPDAYAGRIKGAQQIREALRFETGFDFDLEGWRRFYSVLALGHLIPIARDAVFKQKQKLQDGLRAITAPNADVAAVLNEFLSPRGQLKIPGLGLNTLSKILAVHDPQKWSVFNTPVVYTLKQFGYVSKRGASAGGKFVDFCRSMAQFRLATGLLDALALDAFFFNYAREPLGIGPDIF